jgi:serine/threonine protein kinase
MNVAANILISTNGTIKLADFGVATKLDAVGADTDPAGSPYWSTYTSVSLLLLLSHITYPISYIIHLHCIMLFDNLCFNIVVKNEKFVVNTEEIDSVFQF